MKPKNIGADLKGVTDAATTGSTTLAETVRDALNAEFHARGLLLTDADNTTAAPELLHRAIALSFPEHDLTSQHVEVLFESHDERTRIEQALLFGWVTAEVLAPGAVDDRPRLLCALFNLFIGMIDSFCDTEPHGGDALMAALLSFDVEAQTIGALQKGRMLASLPFAASVDPTIAFIARVIDAFYSVLHATHSLSVRKDVGRLLAQALAAEKLSVAASSNGPDELLEASRNTSVLPFLIMGTLVQGDIAAATHLGEAMWRIDDLIDLEADAESGALNSLLITGAPDRDTIKAVAREAAEHLHAGLGDLHQGQFLAFVHRYTGITPESPTQY
jgi:hypothetical protein